MNDPIWNLGMGVVDLLWEYLGQMGDCDDFDVDSLRTDRAKENTVQPLRGIPGDTHA